jgi:hypothetical protein
MPVGSRSCYVGSRVLQRVRAVAGDNSVTYAHSPDIRPTCVAEGVCPRTRSQVRDRLVIGGSRLIPSALTRFARHLMKETPPRKLVKADRYANAAWNVLSRERTELGMSHSKGTPADTALSPNHGSSHKILCR